MDVKNTIGIIGIILTLVSIILFIVPLLEQPPLRTTAGLDWGDSPSSTLGILSVRIQNKHDSRVDFRLIIKTDDNLAVKENVHSEIQFSEKEYFVGPNADWKENFFVYPTNGVYQKHWIQLRVENPATLNIYDIENKEFWIGEHVDFFK